MYSHAYDQLDLGRIIQLAAENPLQVTQEVHGLYYEKKFSGAPEQEVQEFAFKKYWTMRALHSKLYYASSKSKNRQSNDEKVSEGGHHSVEIRLSESSTFEDYKSYIDRNREILERMMKSIGDFWSIKARHTYQFMKNENIDSFKPIFPR